MLKILAESILRKYSLRIVSEHILRKYLLKTLSGNDC